MSSERMATLTGRVKKLRREAKEEWVSSKIHGIESAIKLYEQLVKEGRLSADDLIKMIVHIELDKVMLYELIEMRGKLNEDELRN